jgi:hypothetical protein
MTKTEEVNLKLAEARQRLFAAGRTYYKHYKGGTYKIDISSLYLDAGTGEAAILYERVAGPDYDEVAEYGVKYGRVVSEFFDAVWVPIDGGVKSVNRFVPVRKMEQTLYVPD